MIVIDTIDNNSSRKPISSFPQHRSIHCIFCHGITGKGDIIPSVINSFSVEIHIHQICVTRFYAKYSTLAFCPGHSAFSFYLR